MSNTPEDENFIYNEDFTPIAARLEAQRDKDRHMEIATTVIACTFFLALIVLGFIAGLKWIL